MRDSGVGKLAIMVLGTIAAIISLLVYLVTKLHKSD